MIGTGEERFDELASQIRLDAAKAAQGFGDAILLDLWNVLPVWETWKQGLLDDREDDTREDGGRGAGGQVDGSMGLSGPEQPIVGRDTEAEPPIA